MASSRTSSAIKTTHLGKQSELALEPSSAILDRVPNPHQGTPYIARFTCPEFTSLCPVTGQPDFAHFIIDYAPDRFLLESKSLKLYLFSFRNQRTFHEDCTVRIGKDIIEKITPHWFRIAGFWFPRGGIPIDVYYEIGERGEAVVPDINVHPYRGRF